MFGDSAVLSLLWALLCIVLILGLAYWVTRYVASRGGGRIPGTGNGGGPLSILAQLTLGKDQRLVLVQAGQRYLLLGVTSAQVTTLAEFTQQEAESWQAACPAESAPPSFGQALRIVLKQKGRR